MLSAHRGSGISSYLVSLLGALGIIGLVALTPRFAIPSDDASFLSASDLDWYASMQIPESNPPQRDYEWLVNGDFDTGTLSPWYGSFWEIDSFFPHSGNFGAKKLSTSGWAWIRQDFQPIPTADIASVSFWMLNTSFNDSYAYLLYDDSTQTECPLPELLV